jgi:GH15 family glucan-1,4-alpha-glucosidase
VLASRIVPTPVTAIEAHVAIGDGRSAALTDGRGTIDWLCWPRFDSDPVFASILDASAGGFFRIAPRDVRTSAARYVEGSNVALTWFEHARAAMDLFDAMLVDGDGTHERSLAAEHEILRVIECTRGGGEVDVVFAPRPGFGAHRVARTIDRRGVRIRDGGALLTLRASRPIRWRPNADGSLACSFALRAGERVAFSLSYAADGPAVLSPLFDAGRSLLDATIATWRSWSAKARYDGPHRAAVERSALALKLLCYPPSGAIVAAPTTSLPEKRLGSRNWDYRYCWLRDAAFTMRALAGLGYEEEAHAFVGWLLHATRLTRPELRILYDVFGETPQSEREITRFTGYGGASPVRVGNAAVDQLQLDVYGEVVDAVARGCRAGREPDADEIDFLRDLGQFVAENWHRPDHGIWEPRRPREHNVHSRVLCWVALDRLLALEGDGILHLSGRQRARFLTERAAIAREVRTRGWSEERQSYVATLDGDRLDAALLLLSWYGFEEAYAPRMAATFAAIEEELGIGRHLLRRGLDHDDDGGFTACAFWAAEHLARGGGTLEAARARFETLLGLAAPCGLYGEIVDPAGTHLGNYPQSFSHLALVNAALSLEERRQR